MNRSIFIGFDSRECDAFTVCQRSIRRHLTIPARISAISLPDVEARGLYWRKMAQSVTPTGDRLLWDEISDAPCSTEFAISRFLVPALAKSDRRGA